MSLWSKINFDQNIEVAEVVNQNTDNQPISLIPKWFGFNIPVTNRHDIAPNEILSNQIFSKIPNKFIDFVQIFHNGPEAVTSPRDVITILKNDIHHRTSFGDKSSIYAESRDNK